MEDSAGLRDLAGRPSQLFLSQRERLAALPVTARGLDLACGRGRHSLAVADLGLNVLALDRKADWLAGLADEPLTAGRIEPYECDLEGATPPTLPGGRFEVVLVFRYLHRALMPWIADQLAPGGLLLYETFTVEQRSLGWGPKRDDFLLRKGELPSLFPTLEIEHYAEGLSEDTPQAHTGRLIATRAD